MLNPGIEKFSARVVAPVCALLLAAGGCLHKPNPTNDVDAQSAELAAELQKALDCSIKLRAARIDFSTSPDRESEGDEERLGYVRDKTSGTFAHPDTGTVFDTPKYRQVVSPDAFFNFGGPAVGAHSVENLSLRVKEKPMDVSSSDWQATPSLRFPEEPLPTNEYLFSNDGKLIAVRHGDDRDQAYVFKDEAHRGLGTPLLIKAPRDPVTQEYPASYNLGYLQGQGRADALEDLTGYVIACRSDLEVLMADTTKSSE